MEPPRFVYVLESTADPRRHYVGVISDVTGRLREHNAGSVTYTMKHRPWRLRAAIEFTEPGAALQFEVPEVRLWPRIRQTALLSRQTTCWPTRQVSSGYQSFWLASDRYQNPVPASQQSLRSVMTTLATAAW